MNIGKILEEAIAAPVGLTNAQIKAFEECYEQGRKQGFKQGFAECTKQFGGWITDLMGETQ